GGAGGAAPPPRPPPPPGPPGRGGPPPPGAARHFEQQLVAAAAERGQRAPQQAEHKPGRQAGQRPVAPQRGRQGRHHARACAGAPCSAHRFISKSCIA
ncbi:hypothetical protein KBW95_11390, partial [Massilia sp. ZL223]|nr:hypothetical protein [Massilia sp. ZL223]